MPKFLRLLLLFFYSYCYYCFLFEVNFIFWLVLWALQYASSIVAQSLLQKNLATLVIKFLRKRWQTRPWLASTLLLERVLILLWALIYLSTESSCLRLSHIHATERQECLQPKGVFIPSWKLSQLKLLVVFIQLLNQIRASPSKN